ncbi:MAG TPA: ABC transporter permease [Opitutaceae bacterium]|nr:ABC transporter permease [Opitutaceae bacterium]
MPNDPATAATLRIEENTEVCRLYVGGRWSLAAPRTHWRPPADAAYRRVEVRSENLERWDAALVLFLAEVRRTCERRGWTLVPQELPPGIPAELFATKPAKTGDVKRRWPLLTHLGLTTRLVIDDTLDYARFMGNCTIAFGQFLRRPRHFRWSDCFTQMQQCGAYGLPIVGLISFLVGVILAYQSAVLLRQFGADIYVADLIGIGVVREMGPMMAAVVLAGRTGAAFAAELGNMKANEEIDALETLGLSPVQFLVLPRLIALQLMMPLLALYANALGILGGLVIAWGVLDLPPITYWIETKGVLDLSDLASGLIKSVIFGGLIGFAGCLRGLQADRSAAGVGKAATSAVVTGILCIIVADAVFAVLFNILGI